jgi:hypothetical protein
MGKITAVMIGLLIAPGCDLCLAGVACPSSGRLEVVVLNDQTGEPICDATVIATEGGFVEQLATSQGRGSRSNHSVVSQQQVRLSPTE